jgi:hypothetical protein
MNAKTHGFLDTMYKKMPHVLVLMAVIQTPIDPNIRPLRLSDVIWHIQYQTYKGIRHAQRDAAQLYAAMPVPAAIHMPLLQRFPLYNGTSTPIPPTPYQTTPQTTLPTYDTKRHPYDNNKRPAIIPPTYPQRSNTPAPYPSNRQQHLQHYQPYEDDFDDYSAAFYHPQPEELHPVHPPPPDLLLHTDTNPDSDDDDFMDPNELPMPPLNQYYHITKEDRRILTQQHYNHVLTTTPPGTDPSVPACYRMLWTGHCARQHTTPRCKWNHDITALRDAWHYHRNALATSKFAPNHQSSHAHGSPVILQRNHSQQHHPRPVVQNTFQRSPSHKIPPPPPYPPHFNHNR